MTRKFLSLPSLLLCPSTFLSEIPQMSPHFPYVPTPSPSPLYAPLSPPHTLAFPSHTILIRSIPPFLHMMFMKVIRKLVSRFLGRYTCLTRQISRHFFFSVRFFFCETWAGSGSSGSFSVLGVWWLMLNG